MTDLARRRKAKGLTQDAVALAAGVAPSTYCYYEIGVRPIPADIALLIAKALDCEIATIFLPIKFTVSKSLEDD